jgi:PAS domain S-box-containing protein
MAPDRQALDTRVLLLAPTYRDGEATVRLLASTGITCVVRASLDALCEESVHGAAAVIVPEEVVLSDESDRLAQLIRAQPVWSDLPVIVLSRTGAESPAVEKAQATLGNVSLIERPMRVSTLLSVVRAALRARERQYQLKDHLEERQQAEERLLRDAMLLSKVRDSVILTDLNGIVTFWNEGATRLFGFSASEMLGRPLADRLPEPSRAEVAAWIKRIAEGDGGVEFNGEWLDERKDGSKVWIEAVTRRVSDASGNPIGIMGVSRDISERKRAEEERAALLQSERAAREEAERAGRTKDEFLATLSHELRTPLNAILGWSQLLAAGPRDEQDLSEGLQTIERNARAQTQIIEDLLDMSRIISGKVRLDVQQVDLASVVRSAIDTTKPAAEAKGVRLQAVLDPAAGPVSGDPSRLQQVFWNLLTNAIKFTPKGGRVQVLLERVNSQHEVSVIDTGEGIRAEFLPHVFDRFRQADASTTRRHGGLGLGLSIVKQLVELHGGTVRVKSSGSGQGSTFTVSLPLIVLRPEVDSAVERRHPRAVASSTSTSPSSSPLNVTNACAQIAGVKVLVVDDEPDARALLKRFLEDCHAQVFTAASADEALELVRTERPNVLASDIGMPGEDGYGLIKRVRALGPNAGGKVPAIALTAYARAEDRVRAIRAGFDMHVAKPVEAAELIAVIASLAARAPSAT